MRYARLVLVAVCSAGWIAPLWLAAWMFADFWQVEGWPRLAGNQPGNSFEWFGPIKTCLTLGFAWMGIAIAYWSWLAASFISRKR